MLRVALLVAVAACVAQARVIAVRVQDGALTSSEPSYAAFSSVQPWLAVTTPFMQDDSSDEDLPEPIQAQLAWAYQQVDLLNSLQSFMLTPRKPCGHMSRALGTRQAPPATSTIAPSDMANMWSLASSRLSSLQAPSDSLEAGAFTFDNDVVFDSTSLPTAADDSVTSSILEAFSDSDSTQTQASETEGGLQFEPVEESFTMTPFKLATDDLAMDDLVSDRRETRSVDGALPQEAVPMEGSMASAAWTGFDQLAQQRDDLDDSLSWSIVDDDGNINWAVVLFGLLCVACGTVWFSLLRTWCALGSSCLSCPRRKRQEQFLTLSADDMTSPLLAPLQHEGLGAPTGTIASSGILGAKNIEIASEHATDGVQYATIAYAPLKGQA